MKASDGTPPHPAVPVAAPRFLVVLGLALAALFLVLRPLDLAMPGADLDDSWVAVLGEMAEVPARWGVDLAFTYGPGSALITRYFTPSYLSIVLPITIMVALVYGACVERLLALSGRGLGQTLAAMGLLSLGLASAHGVLDSFYLMLIWLVYVLDLLRPRHDAGSAVTVAVGAAVLGAVALSKTGFAITAVVLFAASDLRSLAILKRRPLLVAFWAAGLLVTWLAYGQRPGDFPAFARLSWDAAAGYGEAMYLDGPLSELLGFVGAAAALLACLALALRPAAKGRLQYLLVLFGLGFVLLIGFKAGFVRQDTHPQIAWVLLGLLGLGAATIFPAQRRVRTLAAPAMALMACSLIVVWVVAPRLLLMETDAPPESGGALAASLWRDMAELYDNEASSIARFLRGPAAFVKAAEDAKAAAWEVIRTQRPLPPLVGTVDIIPSAQSSIYANKLDYHPRLSFQEYATYTRLLIDANTSFYAGPSAPDWVLFASDAIDERDPNMVEGASWPDLLRRYAPVVRTGTWLGLHRRPKPLPEVLGPTRDIDVRMGEPFAVPPGVVFARVVVRQTLLGRLAAALFRPPGLRIVLTMADGKEENDRFIPALGAGGFLLSPLVVTADGFARLGSGEVDDLVGRPVTHARISGSALSRLFYAPDVAVTIQPLVVKDAEPDEEGRPLAKALRRRGSWLRFVKQQGQAEEEADMDRLSAPAPLTLTYPLNGARHLKLGFGIEDDAWATGGAPAVCFAVRIHPDDADPLWQRCLDPAMAASDRGPQAADLDLSPSLTGVTLETRCPVTCDWGWSYWKDVEAVD